MPGGELAQANKESEEREARMIREIERLLNDHGNTYAHTMTSLEKRLDAKSDLMMRKLDEILNGSNREERSNPRERSRQAKIGVVQSAMPGPSKFRGRTTNLAIGSGPVQPPRGLAGRIQPHWKQMLARRQGCPLFHKSGQCHV